MIVSKAPRIIRRAFYTKKRRTKLSVSLRFALLLFGFDDFSAIIVAAVFANNVGLLELVAMRALDKRRRRSLEVCISRIRSLFGLFRLGYRHLFTPLFYILRLNFVFDCKSIPYFCFFVNLFSLAFRGNDKNISLPAIPWFRER